MDNATEYVKAVKKTIKTGRIFYVCRDLERATAGLDSLIKNYKIITNSSPLSRELQDKYPQIKVISEKEQLDTLGLLNHPLTQKLISKKDFVLVFKNTPQIESFCHIRGWKLINPPAVSASTVEEKISQVKFLGNLKKYLPNTKIILGKDLQWQGKKFILQFNRAHTGSGTFLIRSKKQLSEITKKFPNREMRISDYIDGPFFTNNNCVWGDKILIGNINFQITGLPPFTDNPFATVGNDWSYPGKTLNKTQIAQYKKIARAVGKKMTNLKWRGLFGIDTVLDKKTGKIYLIEINARQPAGTTFESQLQKMIGDNRGLSVFEAHIGALLKIKNKKYRLSKITSGAQIIQRITNKIINLPIPQKNKDFNFIKYDNTKIGADLLRIQCLHGIMKSEKKLNEFGKKILKHIS
ncbi:MAG TPA: ATP-grasp domain-containing protein [Candidatus Magasanikbacteria bacterium]|nr:ATP-grasp domain-containing protein [Candidatus Magasanikbacteria bacterium]